MESDEEVDLGGKDLDVNDSFTSMDDFDGASILAL